MDGEFLFRVQEQEQDMLSLILRFVSPDIAQKYDLDLPEYEGIDQVVEVGSNEQKL